MIKLSQESGPDLLALYGEETGEISAQETRDGMNFVSVLFTNAELCGIPSAWIEEVL